MNKQVLIRVTAIRARDSDEGRQVDNQACDARGRAKPGAVAEQTFRDAFQAENTLEDMDCGIGFAEP